MLLYVFYDSLVDAQNWILEALGHFYYVYSTLLLVFFRIIFLITLIILFVRLNILLLQNSELKYILLYGALCNATMSRKSKEKATLWRVYEKEGDRLVETEELTNFVSFALQCISL